LSGVPRASKKQLVVEQKQALDERVPDNVTLFYWALGPLGQSAQAQIMIPAKSLAELHKPSLEIDKTNRTLEVIDQGKTVKRYPVALGQNPVNRKDCQDMASTPEGWYKVYNTQPNATYYKALDIDYPRPIDEVRHRLAIESERIESDRPIGGEIQIHGWGIGADWTAGCIALRNDDMDELFADPSIRAGTPVFIAGSQVAIQDKEWLASPPADSVRQVQKRLREKGFYQGAIDGEFGSGTALALGRYQLGQNLPSSCQLDSTTRRHFGLAD